MVVLYLLWALCWITGVILIFVSGTGDADILGFKPLWVAYAFFGVGCLPLILALCIHAPSQKNNFHRDHSH